VRERRAAQAGGIGGGMWRKGLQLKGLYLRSSHDLESNTLPKLNGEYGYDSIHC